ncbi:MAG: hypothetical protein ACI9EW_003465 [Cellvibrionaceae bacterium]|jgi:hypothetical protein
MCGKCVGIEEGGFKLATKQGNGSAPFRPIPALPINSRLSMTLFQIQMVVAFVIDEIEKVWII